ncbi:MAG: hypothetical protein J07AB43_01960 [Candidatus Nanosalina sp. J07AB43]|jgi:hypothetical protein|nr:MAG: hypothetical protein J07AB43_01960 [Candidatus Nanosalina sp. J07AB43]
MKRIRIDDGAAQVLDDLADKYNGTKSGLASEAIRRGCEAIEEELDGDDDSND